MNPCPFSVSFLKFAKWQTWWYMVPIYELAATNLMVGTLSGRAVPGSPTLFEALVRRLGSR